MSTEQWFVGVDWATEQHQICVLEGDGKVVGERQVAHSGDGIAELCTWLDKLSGGDLESVHAAIEMPHGAVVEMLLERKVQVYAINPKKLDRFRDRFTAAGAKDDRRDARVLADSLPHRPAQFSTSAGGGAGADRVAGMVAHEGGV